MKATSIRRHQTLYFRREQKGKFGNGHPSYEVKAYSREEDCMSGTCCIGTWPSHYVGNPKPSDEKVVFNCQTFFMEWPLEHQKAKHGTYIERKTNHEN